MGAAGEKWKLVPIAVMAAALLLAGLGGCGGDDGTTAPASSAGQSPDPAEGGYGKPGGEGKPSAASSQFGSPGADDSVQSTGEEASAAERKAASAVVLGFMRAAAAGEVPAQCSYLSAEALAPLERIANPEGEGSGVGCAEGLAELSEQAPAVARTAAPAGPVGSLRVEDQQGFALYHGVDGSDYVMPLVKEEGEWKIASLAPLELP